MVQSDRDSLINKTYDLPDTPTAAQRSPVPLGSKGSDTESKDKAEAEIIKNSVESTVLVKIDIIINQEPSAGIESLPYEKKRCKRNEDGEKMRQEHHFLPLSRPRSC